MKSKGFLFEKSHGNSASIANYYGGSINILHLFLLQGNWGEAATRTEPTHSLKRTGSVGDCNCYFMISDLWHTPHTFAGNEVLQTSSDRLCEPGDWYWDPHFSQCRWSRHQVPPGSLAQCVLTPFWVKPSAYCWRTTHVFSTFSWLIRRVIVFYILL